MFAVFARPDLLLLLASVALVGCPADGTWPDPVEVDDDDSTATLDDDDSAAVDDCATDEYDWGQGGEWMLPGSACLSCHQPEGHAESTFWTGGTVFVSPDCPEPIEGAVIHIFDADRKWFRLPSNSVGNFWTDQRVRVPVRIALEVDGQVYWKPGLQPGLRCNSCHLLGFPAGLISPRPDY